MPAAAQIVPKRLADAMGAPDAAAAEPVAVRLSAAMVPGGPAPDGAASPTLGWTVFARRSDTVGALAASGAGPVLEARLAPGDYVAHVAHAGTSTVHPFTVEARAEGDEGDEEDGEGEALAIELALDLGAVRLGASTGGEALVTEDVVEFAIHDAEGERRTIRERIAPGETVVLPAGVYRAVVRYGEHNALAGADIRVRPGELTDVTLGVGGAPVRLALVREAGGTVPLAAVSWRVFDPDGKPLLATDEPSPALVLAPGSYTAEVLHEGWTAVHRFDVRAGEPASLRFPAAR